MLTIFYQLYCNCFYQCKPQFLAKTTPIFQINMISCKANCFRQLFCRPTQSSEQLYLPYYRATWLNEDVYEIRFHLTLNGKVLTSTLTLIRLNLLVWVNNVHVIPYNVNCMTEMATCLKTSVTCIMQRNLTVY